MPQVLINDTCVLLKKDKASELDNKHSEVDEGKTDDDDITETESTGGDGTTTDSGEKQKKRYFASSKLDPLRFTSQAGQIGENIVAHLQAHKDAKVKITIDIQADSEEGFKDELIRTVTENSNALDIDQHGFEDD